MERDVKEPLKSLSDDELIRLLKKAHDCAQIMDLDNTDAAIRDLTGARMAGDFLGKKMEELQKAGNELEFDSVCRIADEMIQLLDQSKNGKEGRK